MSSSSIAFTPTGGRPSALLPWVAALCLQVLEIAADQNAPSRRRRAPSARRRGPTRDECTPTDRRRSPTRDECASTNGRRALSQRKGAPTRLASTLEPRRLTLVKRRRALLPRRWALSPVVGALVAACGGSVAHQGPPTDDAGTSSSVDASLDVGAPVDAPVEGASVADAGASDAACGTTARHPHRPRRRRRHALRAGGVEARGVLAPLLSSPRFRGEGHPPSSCAPPASSLVASPRSRGEVGRGAIEKAGPPLTSRSPRTPLRASASRSRPAPSPRPRPRRAAPPAARRSRTSPSARCRWAAR